MCDQMIISWLNFIVLTATLFFIAKYTVITKDLNKISQKQLDELIKQKRLSIIPILYPQLLQHGIKFAMQLTNIGNGVAVNIHIDKVNYLSNEEDTYYEFEDVAMLSPNEPTLLPYASYFLGRIQHPDEGLLQLGIHALADVQLCITFQDLNRESYEEIFQMGKSGAKFISLNLVNNITA